jgi:hypothetical protein
MVPLRLISKPEVVCGIKGFGVLPMAIITVSVFVKQVVVWLKNIFKKRLPVQSLMGV